MNHWLLHKLWMASVVPLWFAAGVHAMEPSARLAGLLQPGSRPALGLGGDPFLSTLDDETGWWSHGRSRGATWVGVESAARVLVSSRLTGQRGNLSASEATWVAGKETNFLARRWTAWGAIVRPQWSRSWRNGSSGVDYAGSTARFDIGLRGTDVVPGLTAQIHAPVWRSNRDVQQSGLHVGLRYGFRERLRVQGRWARSHYDGALQFDLHDSPWAVSSNTSSNYRRFDARLPLPFQLDVEASLERSDLTETTARNKDLRYHLSPVARLQMRQAAVLWGRPGSWRLLVRWSDGLLDGRGTISWGGQQFGKLNYGRARVTSRLVGLQWPVGPRLRALLDYENASASGEMRGFVEAWPFTPTVVDLLGPRRIGKGRFDVQWRRAHAAVDMRFGRRGRGQFGVGWYGIHPAASIDSWRPAFLVFGRADEKRTELSTTELQLLAVSLGGKVSVRGWEADFGVMQFVPVRTRQRNASDDRIAPHPGGSPVEPAASRSSRRAWPSGLQAEISLTRAF